MSLSGLPSPKAEPQQQSVHKPTLHRVSFLPWHRPSSNQHKTLGSSNPSPPQGHRPLASCPAEASQIWALSLAGPMFPSVHLASRPTGAREEGSREAAVFMSCPRLDRERGISRARVSQRCHIVQPDAGLVRCPHDPPGRDAERGGDSCCSKSPWLRVCSEYSWEVRGKAGRR